MESLDRDALQAALKKRKICRFCLCQDHPKLTNIYMRDTRIKSSAPLPIQVMAIASIEIFSNDDMPSYVCSECTSMFEFSYQFKQMCKRADNLLRQFPLTGKWPGSLDKPILQMPQLLKGTVGTPAKYTKPTQSRTQNTAGTAVQQESLLLPKKILNASVKSNAAIPTAIIAADVTPKSERTNDYSITFLDKIENNDELSLDDIHQLVAAEDISEGDYVDMDNVPVIMENQSTKPKLLNKSSIRILNKEAELENEPRLSLPKVKKAEDGKTEIVAEILNEGDEYEGEPDPNNAAVIETNVFPCTYCERTFPLLQLRDIHMKNHLRDRKFQCEHCEKSFFSKYDLHRHSFIHSGEKPYKCSICTQAFSRSSLLTRHEKTHTDVPKYICVHCERQFLLKEDLDKHIERHEINRPFVCKICNKRFAFKQGVERHEVIHSRQQPHTCQYCGESFSTTTKLSRHLTAHAGLRPYPCKYCKKSYLLSHHLTRHLRSHKDVEDAINAISFMCMRCNTNFETRDDLISHSTTHANELNLACPLCKDLFDNMSDLTSHIQNHSKGEAYACEFCDLIFITPEKLQSHTDIDHICEMEAYHTDDFARANSQKEENKKEVKLSDEKLQKTVNEFLDDELFYEKNDSEFSLKTVIKEEKETTSPKVINQIIIQSQNDEDESDQSLLMPLKQRKVDVGTKKSAAQSKTPQQNTKSPILRRKTPILRATSATRDSNQPSIQSLLKLPESVASSSKTPASKKLPPKKTTPIKTSPTKTVTSKTPPVKTSPTETVVPKKKILAADSLPASKIIKVGKDEPQASSSSNAVNTDTSKIKTDKKKVKVQRITVTKAQAAAMVKEGRIKIEDGKIILKK